MAPGDMSRSGRGRQCLACSPPEQVWGKVRKWQRVSPSPLAQALTDGRWRCRRFGRTDQASPPD